MNKTNLLLSIILTLLLNPCFAADKKSILKPTKPTVFEKTAHGVTFSLKQLNPDQVNAFYLGRGFTKAQIKPYTKTCIYTAVLRNDQALGQIHFLRKNWQVSHQDDYKKIVENSEWLELFKKTKVSPTALIAFRLAQIPEEQTYDPNGDWNQGMLSIDLPSGSTFDLSIYWDINGKRDELTLKEVYCAEQTPD